MFVFQHDHLKVFDFGLSKEIPSFSEAELCATSGKRKELFRMTQMVGSPRYMAPEVARGCLYNQACDVYSFSIILWQMLSLKLPYESKALDLTYLVEQVWGGPKRRPDLDPRWDESLQTLIFEAWSPDIKWRPSMKEIE